MGLLTRRAGKIALLAAVVVAGIGLVAFLGLTARAEQPAQAATPGLVTEAPRTDLPVVLDGIVFDSARVGDFVVVGGEFNQVQLRDGSIVNVTGLYAYHIDTGDFIHEFTPELARFSGAAPVVLAVEAAGNNAVYFGGRFGTVDGHPHDSLSLATVSTGAVQTGFRAEVNGAVTDIAFENSRLFIGGEFTNVNGAARETLAELHPTTGATTGFSADIPDISRGPKINITPSNVLVVAHRGATVAGEDRPGLALINLNTNRVLPWRTDFWGVSEIRTLDADVSPDGTLAVLVANGGDFPTLGRDSGVAFDISNPQQTNNEPLWIARNYDSTYSVGISHNAVYIGGHFCWVEGQGSVEPWPGDGIFTNDNSCFGATPADRFDGTVSRDQIAAFDPATGKALDWDPGSNGFEGVWSIEVIDRGLLIGHDGALLGNDGTQPRAFEVGRLGFLDNGVGATSQLQAAERPATPIATPTPAPVHTCNGEVATIVGTNGDDDLVGTEGRDVIVGLRGRDTIRGLGGNDVICGNAGQDVIDAGDGADVVFGNGGRDEIVGGAGRDLLEGGGGKDRIFGGNGADTIVGGKAADRIFGEDGADHLSGLLGPDLVNGGNGTDTCFGRIEGRADNAGDELRLCER